MYLSCDYNPANSHEISDCVEASKKLEKKVISWSLAVNQTFMLSGLRASVRLPRMQTRTPMPKQAPKPFIRVLMERLEASRA